VVRLLRELALQHAGAAAVRPGTSHSRLR
jgi:hypothetical protein